MKRIDLRNFTGEIEIILPNGARLTYKPPSPDSNDAVSTSELATLFDSFIREQTSFSGKRNTTLTGYRRHFRQFYNWLIENDSGTVTEDDWRNYYAQLNERGLSVYTRRNHYRDLSVFARWLVANAFLSDNPLQNVSPPDSPKNQRPKIASRSDITQMIAAANTLRDKSVMMFFLDTGCRLSEAAALLWRDVDLESRVARVTDGKWNVARWLFFSDETAELLTEYRATVPNAPDDHIWHGTQGALTSTGIYQIFRRTARRAGVSGHVNPHAWRHAFATSATENGIPTGTLQQLLGHASLETTQIYLNLDVSALRDAHDKYSPVSRIIAQKHENE